MTRQREAERYLRAYYRVYRRIPWGPLSALVGIARIQRLIFWGELEHMLRVATARWRVHRLCLRILAAGKRVRRRAARMRLWSRGQYPRKKEK
jgi:hypothetical protein